MPLPIMRYLYPPRTENHIPPKGELYEILKQQQEWTAQLKLNGRRTLVYFFENQLYFWNRKGGVHKNWTPSKELLGDLRSVPRFDKQKWTVFDAELMLGRGFPFSDVLYLFDMLVYENEPMEGKTYQYRYKKLFKIFDNPLESAENYIIRRTSTLWFPQNIPSHRWDDAWDTVVAPTRWIEGFVFKNLDSRLGPCKTVWNNCDWQIRCRKETLNYKY